MRQIKTLHVGPYETNCYLIGNPETEQLIIIDPGAEPDTIREEIRGMNMLPVAIFLTHGHFDHIGAVRELQSVFDIPEAEWIDDEDRMYAFVHDDHDLVLIQYYIFDRIMKDVDYYVAGNPIQYQIESFQQLK